MNRFRLFFDKFPGSESVKLGIAALLILLLGLATGWTLSGPPVEAASSATAAVAPAKAAPAPAVTPAPASYADTVARVAPAVVTIRSERLVRTSAPTMQSPFGDDFFGQFFGAPQGRGQRRQVPPREEGALGSGVIVSADGYILTNHHVVDGANQIKVDLPDRRTFDAKVIGSDAPSDLAVLKINASALPTVQIGNSERVRVGDVVLAVGNPLGVGQTVTMGIISAKGRATGVSDGSFEDFLQTDAPINQGNSGGALVNAQGELVGINSQILSPSGGNIGIGFAIPATMAQNVMQQLIKNGVVHRAMLGVTVQGMTSDLARSLGLKDVRGALVASVENGSPASDAGIRAGDVIEQVNHKPVTGTSDLQSALRASNDRPALVLLNREGRELYVALAGRNS